ncbi:MAG: hypothetical protein COV35_06980 [Alphaproteobacteria bacterium CG11_big_fil_rev_8_21_14_0_20_39_49]|nr:MAG: hypothetical protein COV35_06980 [Alphaproteobacteria bacterium CG11_big_fil_rev_8_21_14_0_20_39_49]
MKSNEVAGKFYDIYEKDDKLVFRIYGKRKEVLTTFKLFSKFKNRGVRLIWLIAGILSPFYLLVLLLEALIVAIFLFFMTVAIFSGADIYLVITLAFVFSFVFTAGIGRLIGVIDPNIAGKKQEKRKKVVILEISS